MLKLRDLAVPTRADVRRALWNPLSWLMVAFVAGCAFVVADLFGPLRLSWIAPAWLAAVTLASCVLGEAGIRKRRRRRETPEGRAVWQREMDQTMGRSPGTR